MNRTANRQSDQQRTLPQEEVAAQVSLQVCGVLHDTALDTVTGGAPAKCANNLKQMALGSHG